jgi:ParB/RepB/Spo0J family partition protein
VETVKLKDIKVDPDRFRKEFRNIDELAESIKEYGLIIPLILDEDNNLIAGQRRYLALQKLGWEEVPILRKDVNELRAKELEFEENEQREDFTWQERAMAIKQLHELRLAVHGHKHVGGTIGHSMSQLGEELGLAKSTISRNVTLADALVEHPEISKASSQNEALKMLFDIRERELKDELLRRAAEQVDVEEMKQRLYHADCIEWMEQAEPNQFDVILTDPPYGIDIDESMGKDVEFDDSRTSWEELIKKAIKGMTKVAKPDAHLYIFHAPDGWKLIQEELTKHGWSVDPKPIIWVRNVGIDRSTVKGGRVRNADRRFAMAYEMITFAVRGTKALQKQGEPNVILFPGLTVKQHPTEKPMFLLKQILEQSVLPGDRIFDPFAGSGAVLEAANFLGHEAIGLEKNKTFYAAALHRISQLRLPPGLREDPLEKGELYEDDSTGDSIG